MTNPLIPVKKTCRHVDMPFSQTQSFLANCRKKVSSVTFLFVILTTLYILLVFCFRLVKQRGLVRKSFPRVNNTSVHVVVFLLFSAGIKLLLITFLFFFSTPYISMFTLFAICRWIKVSLLSLLFSMPTCKWKKQNMLKHQIS